jgi:flavin reductase (DIM6/NTAB) family NADH-FMN oxidoreductase RutF
MCDKTTFQSVDLDWAYRLMGFGPLVMVSTTDGLRPNAAAIAWAAPLAKTPPTFALAVGKGHKTYKNIMKTGTFAINIPTAKDVDTVLWTGSVSGNEVDKFSARRLNYRPGAVHSKLPLMDDAAAWLECTLVPGVDAGDNSMVVGVAVAASCRKGVLLADQTWNQADFPTLHHLGGRSFLVGRERVVAQPPTRPGP